MNYKQKAGELQEPENGTVVGDNLLGHGVLQCLLW